MIATEVDGKPVHVARSSDARCPPIPAAKMPAFNLKRSGGYEGLAMSKDGGKLYGLLEGPLYIDGRCRSRRPDGQTALRVIEFDVAGKAWTGRSWLYPLARRAARRSATST